MDLCTNNTYIYMFDFNVLPVVAAFTARIDPIASGVMLVGLASFYIAYKTYKLNEKKVKEENERYKKEQALLLQKKLDEKVDKKQYDKDMTSLVKRYEDGMEEVVAIFERGNEFNKQQFTLIHMNHQKLTNLLFEHVNSSK